MNAVKALISVKPLHRIVAINGRRNVGQDQLHHGDFLIDRIAGGDHHSRPDLNLRARSGVSNLRSRKS
jgi:hypothetical protein